MSRPTKDDGFAFAVGFFIMASAIVIALSALHLL